MTNEQVIQNISPEAEAVSVSERNYKDWHGDTVEEVNFQVPKTDFSLGTVVKNGKMVLLHIGGSPQHTARGNGFAVLQRAIKYAADHNLRFFINEFVPDNAMPLLHKLMRRGYDVREPGDSGSFEVPFSFGDSPSFEIGTVADSFAPFERDW